jgi:ABC-2 type transport system permease protein
MRALGLLSLANIRSFTRDRAALFWTMAFPLIFVILFGLIFQGSSTSLSLAWVDLDQSTGPTGSSALREAFSSIDGVHLTDADAATASELMKTGKVDGIIEVPAGYGAAVAAAAQGGSSATPVQVKVTTDPTQATTSGVVQQVVGSVLGVVNLGGRAPVVVAKTTTIQTENLNAISYLVPSILGMALMQLGIFAAVPLVADRQKMILKRLNATPLRRSQLVGSNVIMRLLIGVVQTIIIVSVGTVLFGMQVTGSILMVAFLVVLGALTFLALGYVIASFASTEDAANGMVSVIQFPMMFLSGTFFVLSELPQPLQFVARLIPLTYLGDALRQVMVGGTAFSPLWFCIAVLLGWTVVCFGLSARFFKWQ